jgi:hypothetical protein
MGELNKTKFSGGAGGAGAKQKHQNKKNNKNTKTKHQQNKRLAEQKRTLRGGKEQMRQKKGLSPHSILSECGA